MNMHISGSGTIPSGEYEKISVSGSGRLCGLVRCSGFSSSGACGGDSLECTGDFKTSGSASFSGSIKAENISVSGGFSCRGDLTAVEKIACSGSAHSGGSVKCDRLSISGTLKVPGDIEAENVRVSGVVHCGGLLNAEDISIEFQQGMEIGSIGGSKISIFTSKNCRAGLRLPLLSSLIKAGTVRVSSAIEGDEIGLERVICPRVTGRIVAIGEGCEIALVQYTQEIEISPNAKVGKIEKI